MKPQKVKVEGIECEVIEKLGWQPSAGKWAIIVRTPDGSERTAVADNPTYYWRFWTVDDKLGLRGPIVGQGEGI